MAEEEEHPVEEPQTEATQEDLGEGLETEQGREKGVEDDTYEAREAGFAAGYETEAKDEDEDFGLDEDEVIED